MVTIGAAQLARRLLGQHTGEATAQAPCAVYRKPLLGLPLDRVRDGTWWAHSTTPDADDWMRRNYPQCHADWLHSAGIALADIGERF